MSLSAFSFPRVQSVNLCLMGTERAAVQRRRATLGSVFADVEHFDLSRGSSDHAFHTSASESWLWPGPDSSRRTSREEASNEASSEGSKTLFALHLLISTSRSTFEDD